MNAPASRPTPLGSARAVARAPVLEVFRSLQGEGLHVGEPQVFLRLAGCPLRCRYCDTPHSWRVRSDAEFLDADEALLAIAAAERGPPRTISLTGGEPLAWVDFALELAARRGPRRLHLETAGAHPRALTKLLDAIDHVSLDLKSPSDLDAPHGLDGASEPDPRTAADWREARRACLALVAGRDACAKIVVTADTDEREVDEALGDVVALAPRLPVYVQPATAMPRAGAPADEKVERIVEMSLAAGLATRCLPQVHRLLGIP